MQSKKLPQLEEYFSYDRLEKASKKEDIPIIYVAYLNILES